MPSSHELFLVFSIWSGVFEEKGGLSCILEKVYLDGVHPNSKIELSLLSFLAMQSPIVYDKIAIDVSSRSIVWLSDELVFSSSLDINKAKELCGKVISSEFSALRSENSIICEINL